MSYMSKTRTRLESEAFATVRFPTDLYTQLKNQAETEDRTVAALVRVAVREYLERAS